MFYRRFTIITLFLLGIGFLGATLLNEFYRGSHHTSLTSFANPSHTPQSPVHIEYKQALELKPTLSDPQNSLLNWADMR